MIQLTFDDIVAEQETFDPFVQIAPYVGTCTCWRYGYRSKCPDCEKHADDQYDAQLAYLKSQAFKDLEEEMFSKYPKIREIVESARCERYARETILERLRRTRPDLSEPERVNYVLLSCCHSCSTLNSGRSPETYFSEHSEGLSEKGKDRLEKMKESIV